MLGRFLILLLWCFDQWSKWLGLYINVTTCRVATRWRRACCPTLCRRHLWGTLLPQPPMMEPLVRRPSHRPKHQETWPTRWCRISSHRIHRVRAFVMAVCYFMVFHVLYIQIIQNVESNNLQQHQQTGACFICAGCGRISDVICISTLWFSDDAKSYISC